MNKTKSGGLLGKFKQLNIPGILIGDIVLFILFGLANNKFLSTYNIILIFRNTCTLLLAAIGLTLVILIGQIDMSIGSVVSMSAVLVVVLYNNGAPLAVAMVAPLLLGLLIGLVNGILIAKFKLDYWVVTFGMMSVFAGLALVVTKGNTVAVKNDFINWIGNGKIAGLYVIIWITVILAALMIWVQNKTKFGYDLFALGGSRNVAAVSGIKVVETSIAVYMLSGLFASIAGLAVACMTTSGSPSVGVDYTFNAMAAVVIGGTAFSGGKGGLVGTVFGALLMKILASGLSLMGIPSTWQKAITGMVIVSLIIIDVVADHRKNIQAKRRVYNNVG
ncbi:MAG: ABC transporter permease [Agathobaculum sp.]|jgi:ribose transport system permease protein|uniref:ABC transporter permease n=1 Tax=Agathobaculum sp. TaxID=2048138 RepID=UPI003D9444CD